MDVALGATGIIVTVLLAVAGYLFTYLYGQRRDRWEQQLALVNKQLEEFYGPLYIASQAGQIAYQALLTRLNRTSDIFGDPDPPSDEVLAEWRVWMRFVFTPINDLRERLILEKAHLIREDEVPNCLLQFVTHVSSYKAILYKWSVGNFEEHIAIIDFPGELGEYAARSYRELKSEQLRLVGKLERGRAKT